MTRSRRNAAFTLIEVLIVLVVMGLMATALLPDANPAIYDQLHAAAQVVSADVAYARSLAITHNSTYRITFDEDNNRYVIEHTGTDPALNVLPDTPFRSPDDPPDQHIVQLDDIPSLGTQVTLVVAQAEGSTIQNVDGIEFGPMGETTRSEDTVVWLTAGGEGAQRYIAVRINPVTGLTAIERYRTTPPPAETVVLSADEVGSAGVP